MTEIAHSIVYSVFATVLRTVMFLTFETPVVLPFHLSAASPPLPLLSLCAAHALCA